MIMMNQKWKKLFSISQNNIEQVHLLLEYFNFMNVSTVRLFFLNFHHPCYLQFLMKQFVNLLCLLCLGKHDKNMSIKIIVL